MELILNDYYVFKTKVFSGGIGLIKRLKFDKEYILLFITFSALVSLFILAFKAIFDNNVFSLLLLLVIATNILIFSIIRKNYWLGFEDEKK